MLRNGLLRCILYTFATDPSSIWHVHTWSMRRNIHIHTPSTQGRWTTWLNLRHTNARAPSCDMVDAAECSMQIQNFDMRQRNAKSCESTDASNAQTCDKVRVQSGTQWCASVIHLPKCVVTIVFKRLRHGVISFSFMPSFFVIHDSCLTFINLNEKFHTEKIRCKNF